MMDATTLSMAGFVSQTTFALTLTLLAWSDRRSKGMIWLAGATGLQLLATASKPFWAGGEGRSGAAAGSCLLILLFFFVYMGLRWFVVRRKLRSIGGPMAVSLAMVLVLAINPFSDSIALAVARLTAIATMGQTVHMLFHTRFHALRGVARTSGSFLMLVMAVVAFRLPIDLHLVHVSPFVQIAARGMTLISVSLLVFSFVAMFVGESKRRLHDETRIDSLTGLRNRRGMEEIAVREVQKAGQTGRPLTLLMMDIDFFKRLNDTWGHGMGDRALRAIGGVLLTVTGADDRVTRMGGEEFAVLLPGYTVLDAAKIAERLRATVEGLRLSEDEDVVSFTVSIGVGEWLVGERGWSEMLRRADVALYRAKREGRNRVVLCSATENSRNQESGGRSAWRPGGPSAPTSPEKIELSA